MMLASVRGGRFMEIGLFTLSSKRRPGQNLSSSLFIFSMPFEQLRIKIHVAFLTFLNNILQHIEIWNGFKVVKNSCQKD